MADGATADTKAALRIELRNRRQAFVVDLARRSSLLVDTLRLAEHAASHLAGATIVAAYMATPFEVDPMPILFRALDKGLRVALPRVVSREGGMTFHEHYPGDPLDEGPLGIAQPFADAPEVTPDLILAPLLGFDRALNRLGQGKGFYDRAFAAAPDARRIGIAWSAQEVDRVPSEAWDVPLHGVVTEQGRIAG